MMLPNLDDLDATVGDLAAGDYGVDLDGRVLRLVGEIPGGGGAVLVLCGSRADGRPVEVEAEWGHRLKRLSKAEAGALLARKQRGSRQ